MSTDGLTIRAAGQGDVLALVELGAAVVPATYAPISQALADHTLRTWWSEEAIADSVERLPHWVAEDDAGRLLGVANLGRRDDRAVMWKLYVHPDAHGRRIGSALLDAVLDEVGDEDLWLEYVDGNARAAAFYRSRGFEEVEREPFPSVPGEVSVWMRRRR